jgi:KUP system potassium uptake protein
LVYFVMVVWHVGAASVSTRLQEAVMPVAEFMKKSRKAVFRACSHGRVSDTDAKSAPPVMVWHLKHNRALYLF